MNTPQPARFAIVSVAHDANFVYVSGFVEDVSVRDGRRRIVAALTLDEARAWGSAIASHGDSIAKQRAGEFAATSTDPRR